MVMFDFICMGITYLFGAGWVEQEQGKSSDIEQQPPFGDRKISNVQPQNRGRGFTKPTGIQNSKFKIQNKNIGHQRVSNPLHSMPRPVNQRFRPFGHGALMIICP